jgi:hypothetical protein
MLDLRLLGFALRRIPVSRIVSRLMPWTVAGFVVMVVSGALLFFAIPIRSYHSVFFRVKVVLLILAGVNAWIFHGGVWRRVIAWDLDPIPPASARLAGAASLVFWFSIIFAGRLIAYNWFDCDMPQGAAIQWASGCTGESKR